MYYLGDLGCEKSEVVIPVDLLIKLIKTTPTKRVIHILLILCAGTVLTQKFKGAKSLAVRAQTWNMGSTPAMGTKLVYPCLSSNQSSNCPGCFDFEFNGIHGQQAWMSMGHHMIWL